MSFTERLKVIIDVTSNGATKGLADFRTEVGKADTFTGKLRAGTKSLGSTFSQFAKSPAGIATGIAAVGAAAFKAANEFSELAKTALDVGKATGLGTEAASRWIAVADDAGISAEQFATGVGKIARSLDSGKWENYGIATRDASGNLRDANAVFLDALDVLSRTNSATERAKVGADLFGKGWSSLAPLLGKTRDEYDRMLSTVSDGQVVTDAEVIKGEQWRLAMDNLQDSLKDVGAQAGELVVQLAPLIETVATLIEPLGTLFDWTGLTDTTDQPLTKLQHRLDEVGKSTWGATTAFTEFSSAYVENLNMVDQISAMVDMNGMSDVEKQAYLAKRAFEELAATSPDAARQVLDSIEATMLAAARGNEAARILVQGWGLTIPILSDLKAMLPDVAGEMDGTTDAATGLSEAAIAQADAFKEATRAMKAQRDLQNEMYADQRDAIERQRDYNDANSELMTVMADSSSTMDDQLQSIINLSKEYGTLKGASLDSAEGTRRQIDKLTELTAGLDPNSDLYKALQEYIKTLKQIPTNVNTMLRLGISSGATFTAGGDAIGVRVVNGEPTARALGGPVSKSSMYQVAEGGKPELLTDSAGRTFLIPGRDGVVTPISGTGTTGSAGGHTFNITITNPVMSGEQLANELRRYIQRNGNGWLQ